MATRHIDPGDELWRTASRAFVSVLQSGLPSINIAAHSQTTLAAAAPSSSSSSPAPYSLASLASGLTGGYGAHSQATSAAASPASTNGGSSAATSGGMSVPPETWEGLVRAFEMALLGRNLPGALPGGAQPNPSFANPGPRLFYTAITAGGKAPSSVGGTQQQSVAGGSGAATPSAAAAAFAQAPLAESSSVQSAVGEGTPSALQASLQDSMNSGAGGFGQSSGPTTTASDPEVLASVLDCLADTVLTSCQYAPPGTRKALVALIETGAASAAPHEADLPPSARFSHACLAKLYVLCSRGQDSGAWPLPSAGSGSGASMGMPFSAQSAGAGSVGSAEGGGGGGAASALLRVVSRGNSFDGQGTHPPLLKDQSARCQLEVAQVALPLFLNQ
jgi:hypothetical protein